MFFRKGKAGIVWLLAILVGGLIGPAALAQSAPANQPPVSSNNNLTEDMEDPVSFSSAEGKFAAVFPPGCPQMHTLFTDGEPGQAKSSAHVYCDRYNQTGEGYSITVWFEMAGPEGANPGLAELRPIMEDAMGQMGVQVSDQVSLAQESDSGLKMEGMDLLTKMPQKKGQAWFRGWVIEDRIYLLKAWRVEGDLLEQSGVAEFFNSFQPL